MTTQITTGSFTNAASTPFFLPLTQQIDEFRLVNLTMSGVTAGGIAGALTSDRIVEAEFFPRYMSGGTALVKQNGTVAGVIAPLQNGVMPQNGFTIFNAANQQKGPNIALLSFVPGQPTVFTAAAPHGFQVGDNVRIGSMTSSPELSGLVMTVTAIGGGGTTFTTLIDSTNSLTSVGVVYKVGNANLPSPSLYYPEWRVVASITQANPMVVTLLVRQNYQVGDVVRFNIPQGPSSGGINGYGMPEINSTTNGLPVEFTVIAVNNAIGTQTVTLAVDSTNFTAFAFPGTGFYPIGLPVMIPQGEGNINNFQNFGVVPAPLPYGNQDILGFATQNQGRNGILIGAGDGTNALTTGGIIGATVDVWEWRCISSLQTFP
jgi:hypothetical protein